MFQRMEMVVCDIDGTMYNHEHRLTERTAEALRGVVRRGKILCIATGRNLVDAEQIIKRLGVDGYLVTCNGAHITDSKGVYERSLGMPQEYVQKVLEIPIEETIHRNLYHGRNWFVERPEEVFTEYYEEGFLMPQIVDLKEYYDDHVEKIFFTSHNTDALIRLEDVLKENFGDVLNITFSMNFCLEVMAKQVDKGVAVGILAEKLSMPRENILVFGDGLNDYEMLRDAGVGYIMENGSERLKAKLPHLEVIRSNSEDGVAQKLEEIYRASDLHKGKY